MHFLFPVTFKITIIKIKQNNLWLSMVSLLSQSRAEKLNGQKINKSTQQIHGHSPVWPSPLWESVKLQNGGQKRKKLKELPMSSSTGRSQTFISGYNRHL